MRNRPFEGILGDTCELRIIEFLLPLKDCVFTRQEIAEMIGSSMREVNISLERFVKWGIVNKIDRNQFSINTNSPILQTINDFNLSLITIIIEEEKVTILGKYPRKGKECKYNNSKG